MLLQLDPNLLTSIPTSDSPTGEQCLPLFSAIALKQKRRMLFAPMDFQHFSIEALIDSGALVNCMPESEFQKLKNISPIISFKKPILHFSNYRSQMATLKAQPRQIKSSLKLVIGRSRKPLLWRTKSQALS